MAKKKEPKKETAVMQPIIPEDVKNTVIDTGNNKPIIRETPTGGFEVPEKNYEAPGSDKTFTLPGKTTPTQVQDPFDWIKEVRERYNAQAPYGNTYQIGNTKLSAGDYEVAKRLMNAKQTPEVLNYLSNMGIESAQKTLAQQQQQQQLISSIGQGEVQPVMEQSPTDWNQVWQSTLTDPALIGKVAATAGAFAAGGSFIPVVGTGVGAIIGAAVGLATGIYSGVRKNIAAQRAGEAAAQKKALTAARTYGNQIASLIKMFPDRADEYIASWNELQNNARQAYAQLKYDTQTNLNMRLGEDGTEDKMMFELYFGAGGGYDAQRLKIEAAIANPNFEEGVMELMMTQVTEEQE